MTSDFYIEDMSFLRLKNIEFGYTLPASVSEKVFLKRARVFIGAQNLLTFTKVENYDPERAGGANSSQNAPLYKTYTAGVNLKF